MNSNIDFTEEVTKCYENIEIGGLPPFASCFTLPNLSAAAIKCAKGTRWKYSVQKYLVNRNLQCLQLHDELMSGCYHLSESYPFIIFERGKQRIVKSTPIRDRTVQRCLCDHVIVPIINEIIIDNNTACIKGKGLSYAIAGVRKMVEDAPLDAWVLKFDLRDYFGSIISDRAFFTLSQFIQDPDMLNLIYTILRDNHGGASGQGLELGSHLSQLCGVMYLDPLDKRMQTYPGVHSYARYMDDGYIICGDKYVARELIDYLTDYTAAFGLTLSPRKTFYNKITQPSVFCKRTLTKTADGVTVTIKPKAVRRSMNHLRSVLSSTRSIDLMPAIASTLGYVNSADEDLTHIVADVLTEFDLDINDILGGYADDQ